MFTLAPVIKWEDFSRGFHGGRFESDEIETFNFSNEIQTVQFCVQEYTSDEEDFFGTACPRWEIILTFTDIRSTEYCVATKWRIGENYCKAEYAQEFCDYALQSIAKHGNLSRLPISEIVED